MENLAQREFSQIEKNGRHLLYIVHVCEYVVRSSFLFFGNTFHCIWFTSIRFPRVALMLLCDKTFPG